MQAVAHIYLQLNQTTKAHEALKKTVRIDPRDPEVIFYYHYEMKHLVNYISVHLFIETVW